MVRILLAPKEPGDEDIENVQRIKAELKEGGFIRDKYKAKETLELAVKNTHLKYPVFQGVMPFGSFVTDKNNPSDIDLVPVFGTFEGDWLFRTDDEGYNDTAYYKFYESVKEFFVTHFLGIAKGYDSLIKTVQKKNALIHIESLVALDDMAFLKERLDHYDAKHQNFIGTEHTRQKIFEYYERREKGEQAMVDYYREKFSGHKPEKIQTIRS